MLRLGLRRCNLFFRELMPCDAKNITYKTVNKAHTAQSVSPYDLPLTRIQLKQHKEKEIWSHLSILLQAARNMHVNALSHSWNLAIVLRLACSLLQNKHPIIFLGLNIEKSCMLKDEKPSPPLHQLCLLPKPLGPTIIFWGPSWPKTLLKPQTLSIKIKLQQLY